jgi:hypothetical protein
LTVEKLIKRIKLIISHSIRYFVVNVYRIAEKDYQVIQGNDHEIEFHEIKIAIFHEIKIAIFHEIKIAIFHEIKCFAKLIMRSKLAFFRRSKLFAKLIRKGPRGSLFKVVFSNLI